METMKLDKAKLGLNRYYADAQDFRRIIMAAIFQSNMFTRDELVEAILPFLTTDSSSVHYTRGVSPIIGKYSPRQFLENEVYNMLGILEINGSVSRNKNGKYSVKSEDNILY